MVASLFGATAFIALTFLTGSAWAQATPATTDEYAAAAAALRADPTNLDKSFALGVVAVKLGRLSDAVTAFERLLALNPQLDNIRLELGLLYARLGSIDTARVYLGEAMASPDIPPAVKERAQTIMAQLDRAASRHMLSGSVTFGIRHDSNVNLGPASSGVQLFGTTASLDPKDLGKPDYSSVASASATYKYDLEGQSGDYLEASLQGYDQRYFSSRSFNTQLVQADIGPWLSAGKLGGQDVRLRPYLQVAYLTLENQHYLVQTGGGLQARRRLTDRLDADLGVQVMDQKFQNSKRRRTVTEQDGVETQTSGALTWRVTPSQTATLTGFYYFNAARVDAQSKRQMGARVSYGVEFPDFFGLLKNSWAVQASAEYRSVRYDSPDPIIDEATRRRDNRYTYRLTGIFSITDQVRLIIAGESTQNFSNFSNFRYDNLGASSALVFSF
jgi:hypothetical protein